MTAAAAKFCPALLALSEADREELAQALFESLKSLPSEDEERAFEDELTRREEEMHTGRVVGLTAEEFFADIKDHLASLQGTAQSLPASHGA